MIQVKYLMKGLFSTGPNSIRISQTSSNFWYQKMQTEEEFCTFQHDRYHPTMSGSGTQATRFWWCQRPKRSTIGKRGHHIAWILTSVSATPNLLGKILIVPQVEGAIYWKPCISKHKMHTKILIFWSYSKQKATKDFMLDFGCESLIKEWNRTTESFPQKVMQNLLFSASW